MSCVIYLYICACEAGHFLHRTQPTDGALGPWVSQGCGCEKRRQGFGQPKALDPGHRPILLSCGCTKYIILGPVWVGTSATCGKGTRPEEKERRSPSNCCLTTRKDAAPTRTNTHPTQATRPLTANTMVLMPPITLPPVAASFSSSPTASTRVDTKSQGEAVPLSGTPLSSSASSSPDHEEGTPVPTHALTCLTTFSFLFSPFLGPKDCLTMAGLQKVRKEEKGRGRLESIAWATE